jgi:hypothetical protein
MKQEYSCVEEEKVAHGPIQNKRRASSHTNTKTKWGTSMLLPCLTAKRNLQNKTELRGLRDERNSPRRAVTTQTTFLGRKSTRHALLSEIP